MTSRPAEELLAEGCDVGAHGELLVRPILEPGGRLASGATSPLSDAQIVEALKLMTHSRLTDDRGVSLQRQGRIGTYSEARGQEAATAGSALAIDPRRDWVVQTYRELPALLRQGMTLEQYWMLFIGHPDGWAFDDDVKVFPLQIELGAQLPHAVGMAWGLQHQSKPGVVIGYVGDGASSEGDFYESGNLAGVTKAPVVLFVQNNGWAISTPRLRQTAAATIAAKAAGWGVPSFIVDGNDVMSVYFATRAAVARARRGEGATLIEAITHRAGAHNTSDAPSRYRDEDAASKESIEQDPLDRLKTYAFEQKLWDEERDATFIEETYARIDAAFSRAQEAAKTRSPAMLFDHVYAEPPPRVLAQREMIESEVD